jgi:hypothetical protein
MALMRQKMAMYATPYAHDDADKQLRMIRSLRLNRLHALLYPTGAAIRACKSSLTTWRQSKTRRFGTNGRLQLLEAVKHVADAPFEQRNELRTYAHDDGRGQL